MPSSNLPDELQKAFARHRLPPAYAKRLMDELSDHVLDLVEENPHMETSALAAQLGNPDQLAKMAAHEYRRRTFAGRHPVVTFVIAPIPSVVALIVAVVLVPVLIAMSIPDESIHSNSGIAATSVILAVVTWTLRVLPFSLAAVLFWRAAVRSGCDWRWGLTATFLLAIFAGTFAVSYEVPTGVPESGRFGLGFGLPPGPVQFVQFCMPIAIALWHFRRGNVASRRAAAGVI